MRFSIHRILRSTSASCAVAFFATADAQAATALQNFQGTLLDVPAANASSGPAGRFTFDDWEWPADVDEDHDWPVDPRTYATRGVDLDGVVVGTVQALRGNGPAPTRSLTWDRALRPTLWHRGDSLLGSLDDGVIVMRRTARGQDLLILSDRKSAVLEVPRVDQWKPLASHRNGLIVGVGESGDEEKLVLYKYSKRRKGDARVLPLPSTRAVPRAVNDGGWLVGSRDGRPWVLGPLTRDGKLLPQKKLESLTPLDWKGADGAELVTIAGLRVLGHAPDGQGGRQAFVWPLDPRASSIGEQAEQLPALGSLSIVIDGNEKGQIVGASGGRPVLWEQQAGEWRAVDLRRRLPKNASYELLEVVAINEKGHLVGTASVDHGPSGERYRRAIRLTPRTR